jgi:hypothetical protein
MKICEVIGCWPSCHGGANSAVTYGLSRPISRRLPTCSAPRSRDELPCDQADQPHISDITLPKPHREALFAPSLHIMAPFVVGSQKDEARANTTPLEQRLGQATSVVMPLLECGALGFITWVLCYLICIQYLIDPSEDLRQSFNVHPRRSTGISLIVVHAILLLAVLIPWMRFIQVVWSKPDILPLGDPTLEKKDADSQPMEQYDAYICDYEGVPLFCEKCRMYKPDRTHHCKELGRCVRKMDHYCPWAGGIVAQTSHKFFMQGVFFGAVYMTFVWLVIAIFLADRISKVSTSDVRNSIQGKVWTANLYRLAPVQGHG